MAQLNLLERATEAVVMLNGNRRQVLDMWLNGKKVWPIDEPVVELAVNQQKKKTNGNYSELFIMGS